MKRTLWILALFPMLAFGQGVRYSGNVYTINSSAPQPGSLYPVLANTSATVQICTYSTSQTCPALATTYTDATTATPCLTSTQLTPSNSGACTASVDAQGNFGAWLYPGNYQYMVTTSYGTFGPYDFTVGGGSAAGVSSLNTLTGALTLTISGYTCTSSGTTIACTTQTPFTINSFSGCAGTVELGANIVNPAFTASYSATPSSAAITNTDGIASPTNLSPPFTSQTVTGTFTHSALTTTTFTLTAVASSTQMATCTDTWKPRIFGGVAAAGATSTVTASGTTAVLSNSTAIASAGLGAETVGQVIGSFTPSAQAIYLLLTGSSHTFTDNNTGFPMAFNSPLTVTFTNVNGVTLTMYLYQTTNSLYANFQPKVAS